VQTIPQLSGTYYLSDLLMWKYDENRTSFSSVIRSMMPALSSLSVRGLALSEYISALRQISISEGFRISHDSENTRKRRYMLWSKFSFQRSN